ncbi:hypothetical protein BGX24_002353 [Mortierella sp. AD032]|nr:hypothetical protein BGX24_002353 [Mortierella sp. AD032]
MDTTQTNEDSGHDSRNQGKPSSLDTPKQINPAIEGYGAVPDYYSGLPMVPSGTTSSPPHESDSLLSNASHQERNEQHVESHHPRKWPQWQRLFDIILDRIEDYWPLKPPPPPPPPPPTKLDYYMNTLGKWSWDELSYVCVVDDIKASHLSLSFNPSDYKNFFFQLDHDIKGDIFVGKSYNNNSPNITIQVTAHASSTEILQTFALEATPQLSLMEAKVYLNMTSAQARKMPLRKGCTLVKVDILLPTNLTRYESLWIHHRERGNVNVKMSRGHPGGANRIWPPTAETTEAEEAAVLVIDQLDIQANAGWVTLQDVVVSSELSVVSRLGGINGQVDVEHRVIMDSAKEMTLELSSSSPNLDLKVTSKERARVVMKKTAHSLIGYVPDSNGDEPGYLPRIEVRGKAAVVELLG